MRKHTIEEYRYYNNSLWNFKNKIEDNPISRRDFYTV